LIIITSTSNELFLCVAHMLRAVSSSSDMWIIVNCVCESDVLNSLKYAHFVSKMNCFDVGKAYLHLLNGAAFSTNDIMCSF